MDRTIITLLVSALTIAALEFGCSDAICSQESFISSFDLTAYLPSLGLLSHPSDILVTSYRFTCEGTITHWEAYTTGTGSHPIEFQVWREAPELLRYNLVGNNIFPITSPTNRMLRLDVPIDQQITVMPGDFVGVRTIEGSEDDPFQILTILGSYVNYSLTDRGFDSTPQQLRLGILAGVGCFTPPNIPPTRTCISPLINAVLNGTSDDVSTPNTDTTTPPPADPTTPDPTTPPPADPTTSESSNTDPATPPPADSATSQALLVTTAILAGLLLTLLILLIVTVTLFCCYMQHKRGGQAIKGPASLTPNTAYSSSGGGVELTHNTAYNDDPYYSSIAT